MMKKERWLILGCGYLGTELAQRALRRGVAVTALTRNPQQAAGLRSLGCDAVIEADVADVQWLHSAVGKYSALINCVSGGGLGIEGYRRSYVEGQERVAEWIAKQNGMRAVYTSSTSVYTHAEGEVVDETASLQDMSQAGALLLQAEQLFQQACHAQGVLHYVLRLPALYGPGRHHLLDAVRSGVTTLPGDGSIWLNFIHRDDVCSAVERVLDQSLPPVPAGVYNLADEVSVTRQEFVQWLAGQLGKTAPRYDASLTSSRIQRRRRSDGRTPHRRISAERFRSLAAWEPHYPDFKAGYAELLGQGLANDAAKKPPNLT